MLRDFPKIIRIIRQRTVPSCLNPPNISQMYEPVSSHKSAHTRLSRKMHISVCYWSWFELKNKRKNRCMLRLMWEDKSVPPSIINGGSSEKPLLKSLIAYGQVSRPSGGWLAVPEHQHTEGIYSSSKEREGRQRNMNLKGRDDDEQHINMEPSEASEPLSVYRVWRPPRRTCGPRLHLLQIKSEAQKKKQIMLMCPTYFTPCFPLRVISSDGTSS